MGVAIGGPAGAARKAVAIGAPGGTKGLPKPHAVVYEDEDEEDGALIAEGKYSGTSASAQAKRGADVFEE